MFSSPTKLRIFTGTRFCQINYSPAAIIPIKWWPLAQNVSRTLKKIYNGTLCNKSFWHKDLYLRCWYMPRIQLCFIFLMKKSTIAHSGKKAIFKTLWTFQKICVKCYWHTALISASKSFLTTFIKLECSRDSTSFILQQIISLRTVDLEEKTRPDILSSSTEVQFGYRECIVGQCTHP